MGQPKLNMQDWTCRIDRQKRNIQYGTDRAVQEEQDRQKRTGRIGQAEQNRTGSTGQEEQDRRNKTEGTGQAEQEWQNKTARTIPPGKDCQDWATSGLSEQDCQDRTDRKDMTCSMDIQNGITARTCSIKMSMQRGYSMDHLQNMLHRHAPEIWSIKEQHLHAA
jgi:hypothetical protein